MTVSYSVRLEAAKEAFSVWRDTRTRREKIPDYLWAHVQGLTKDYASSRIASELRLNHGTMRQRLVQTVFIESEALSGDKAVDFISFPFVPPPVAVKSMDPPNEVPCPTIEIKRRDGSSVHFTHLGPDQINKVLDRLVGESPCYK